ncbi:MAG TPA: twin-arginine translocation signal domain-containing protein, partial [Candidatus Hydrogenedentes bacterium]|nr:twin-arginine translocation signal domain-containing protein [Candidatus Hydrogenedentota bacterium]
MKSAMNRRHFLKGSLAAGAALTVPQIILAAAFDQGDTPPPSEQITIGCIGVGRMGRNNLNDFIKLPDCRIVAVCDTYQENLALAKDIVDTHYQNTDCATYGDFRDLLARADIDA